jgi:hypothetical protein
LARYWRFIGFSCENNMPVSHYQLIPFWGPKSSAGHGGGPTNILPTPPVLSIPKPELPNPINSPTPASGAHQNPVPAPDPLPSAPEQGSPTGTSTSGDATTSENTGTQDSQTTNSQSTNSTEATTTLLDWVTANWIYIALAIGVLWFLKSK